VFPDFLLKVLNAITTELIQYDVYRMSIL